jgi:hypothetical protein
MEIFPTKLKTILCDLQVADKGIGSKARLSEIQSQPLYCQLWLMVESLNFFMLYFSHFKMEVVVVEVLLSNNNNGNNSKS